MGRMKTIFTAVCVTTLLTAVMAAAQGVLPHRKTVVTFSGPVSLPGTTLAAGTYVFKIADSPANRNIVQIFDRDDPKLITTILADPPAHAAGAHPTGTQPRARASSAPAAYSSAGDGPCAFGAIDRGESAEGASRYVGLRHVGASAAHGQRAADGWPDRTPRAGGWVRRTRAATLDCVALAR